MAEVNSLEDELTVENRTMTDAEERYGAVLAQRIEELQRQLR
jgi:hypothetical protein